MLVIIMMAAPAVVTYVAISVVVSIAPGSVLPVAAVMVPLPWLLIVIANVYSARPMGSGISGMIYLAAGCRVPSLLRQGRLLVVLVLIGGDRALPMILEF